MKIYILPNFKMLTNGFKQANPYKVKFALQYVSFTRMRNIIQYHKNLAESRLNQPKPKQYKLPILFGLIDLKIIESINENN